MISRLPFRAWHPLLQRGRKQHFPSAMRLPSVRCGRLHGQVETRSPCHHPGGGAAALQLPIEIFLERQVPLPDGVGGLKSTAIVQAYKHVGTKMIRTLNVHPELRCRTAKMKVAAGPMMRNVIRNTSTQRLRQVHLCKALLVTTLSHATL